MEWRFAVARIGGDTRVRYAYCREYLLPSLLYAADQIGEEHAAELIEAQIQLIAQEAEYSDDGSFYGKRLAHLEKENPYYFTRLQSDRTCALAMLLAYSPLVPKNSEPKISFEATVGGGWYEPEHGTVLHRSPTRFASFAWRSNGRTQGLCLPPGTGHLAKWRQNLTSVIRFLGDDGDGNTQRKVLRHRIETFDGGLITCGEVAEGWSGTLLDISWMAISNANAQETERVSQSAAFFSGENARAARVPVQDEKTYAVVFNFGDALFETALLD